MNVGNNIRKYRKEKKLTQKELATLSEISQNSIQRYETGQREPNYSQLTKIAEALSIPATKLIEKDLNINLSANLKIIREEQNISRKQLADELGITEKDIIKFETIPKSIPKELFPKICRILDIHDSSVFARSDLSISAHKKSIAIDGFLSMCLYLGINIELEPDEDGNLLQANIRYGDTDFYLSEKQYNHLFKEVCNSIMKEVLFSQNYDLLGIGDDD